MTSQLKTIDDIFSLEKAMLSMEQLPLDVTHHFSKGVYARQMFIPKGTILTGKLHKHNHLNVMLYGDIEVATEDGAKRMTEPCMFESKAGTKRAGFAHEDTVWITIHEIAENPLQYLEDLRSDNL